MSKKALLNKIYAHKNSETVGLSSDFGLLLWLVVGG